MNDHFFLRDGVVYCFSEAVFNDFVRHGCRCVWVTQSPDVMDSVDPEWFYIQKINPGDHPYDLSRYTLDERARVKL